MKKAELIKPDGSSNIILARDYDPETMPGTLRCAHGGCEAELYYRPPAQANGGRFIAGGVFASKSRSDHSDGCTMLKPQDEQDESPRITLKEAIENNWPIAISLNLPSLSTPFQRATRHGFKYHDTEEARFYRQNRHKYARISVRNTQQLCKLLNKIQKLATEMNKERILRSVKVIWRGLVLPMSQFLYMDQGNQEINTENANTLLSKIKAGQGKTSTPVLMQFIPTEASREEETITNLRGSPTVIAHKGKKALILIHRLDVSGLENAEGIAKHIRSQPSSWLLMRPKLPDDRNDAYQNYTRASAERPSTHYIVVDWVLSGTDNYAVTVKKSAPKPQKSASISTKPPAPKP